MNSGCNDSSSIKVLDEKYQALTQREKQLQAALRRLQREEVCLRQALSDGQQSEGCNDADKRLEQAVASLLEGGGDDSSSSSDSSHPESPSQQFVDL